MAAVGATTTRAARPKKRRVAFADLRTVVFIALRQLWERKLLNGIAIGGVVLGSRGDTLVVALAATNVAWVVRDHRAVGEVTGEGEGCA